MDTICKNSGATKYVALSNLSMYYTWKYIKILNLKYQVQSRKFELPGGSYSVSHIQGYFQYIVKKYQTVTDNSLIRIYVNK